MLSKSAAICLGAALFCAAFGIQAMAAQSITLGWNASATSGTPGYYVYKGSASGTYSSKVDAGTNTSAVIPGLTGGATYYFVVSAYNAAGMESSPSPELAVVVPNSSPLVLQAVPDQTLVVGQMLVLTNIATEAGFSAQNMSYSLLSGPKGMKIYKNTGRLLWLPGLAQAGTTNQVTVQVSDNGAPPITVTQTFNAVVADALQLEFSNGVIAVGQSGSVVVSTTSSGSVTNISFTLDVPAAWVNNVTAQSLVRGVTVTQTPAGATHSQITVQTTGGQTLQGQQDVLQINIATTAGKQTSIGAIKGSEVTAALANGELVASTPDAGSPLVFVGSDSILASQINNGQYNLTLYGPIGASYQIESMTGKMFPAAWTNEVALTMTNLFQVYQDANGAGQTTKIYRARHL